MSKGKTSASIILFICYMSLSFFEFIMLDVLATGTREELSGEDQERSCNRLMGLDLNMRLVPVKVKETDACNM